ncbi:transposase [Enterococcus faecium]|uniref:Transposase n=1 Tax=Enterococcus faecium TaxID=1352 RepID=A0A242AMQ1_ENTFC|nr:transposase [Enterococcus faecium]
MKLFVGIDVSSEKLDICFLTDDDQLSILSEISVANDIEGASLTREMILKFNENYQFDRIVIGMESTSMYNFHPSMFFHGDEKLKKLNTFVTIENPFRVKQFSRMFDEDKTDRNDALRIADFLRIQWFTTSPIKEEKYMALQRLTRTRYQLIKELTRTKQHFLENLTYKCSTLAREMKDESTSLFSATVISLMTEDFTFDELAALPLEAFCDLLQKKGRGRFK